MSTWKICGNSFLSTPFRHNIYKTWSFSIKKFLVWKIFYVDILEFSHHFTFLHLWKIFLHFPPFLLLFPPFTLNLNSIFPPFPSIFPFFPSIFPHFPQNTPHSPWNQNSQLITCIFFLNFWELKKREKIYQFSNQNN